MATFYNQATLSYNGSVTSSNITAGSINQSVTASKNAVIDTYSPDDTAVYIISVVNDGASAIDSITLTDDLGAYEYGDPAETFVPLTYVADSVNLYVNGGLQPQPTVTGTSPLTITGISIPAGGNALIIYAAEVNQYAPLGSDASIVNTAVISAPGITGVTATETITPSSAADLAISKSLSPIEVNEGGTVTYPFVIQNFGSSAVTADDTVVFSDDFTPALSSLTAQFNGVQLTEGTDYTYSEATGEFRSALGTVTVPAAETARSADGTWTIQPGVSTLIITGTI